MLRTPLLAALVVTSLLSGCAAGTRSYGASSNGHAPPLAPGQIVPMWDHYCAYLDRGRGGETVLRQLLDEASASGWEMVAVSDFGFCFKRPHPSETAAPGAAP